MGDRDGTMLRAGPADRDGGGRRRTKHQEDGDEQRTERAENRWLKKGKRKEEKPHLGENLCLPEMHMLHSLDPPESSIRALWSGPHPGAYVTLHAPPLDPLRPMIDAHRDKTPAGRQQLLPLRYNGETLTYPSQQTYRICAVITDSVALDKSRRILPSVSSPKGNKTIHAGIFSRKTSYGLKHSKLSESGHLDI
ncbi:hypothetical protein G5714_005241 [Onychostoma macrolepis]|uniref:Uncharacterized protein n=1 Tax=Onychostoma macrolepis TaxID=369639 RepID=A0A7J6D0F1_9TELE|nr:hypothetical protein G5714_005241 [Onychostoma macrolepis]